MLATGPHRVLNVNDRVAARYLITRMLRSAGFGVEEVGDGERALAAADGGPDAIVLDVRLPGIDGFEVCRRLKSNTRTAPIPILLTSASFVETEERVVGLDAGADAYLVQPFEAAELAATLRALLRVRAAERRASALADQLAAAVHARDEFLSIASHELRTPIAALHLRLETLGRELRKIDQEGLAGRADAALRQTMRLTALVNDLLDVSRSASGRFRIEREEADLAVVVHDVVDRFALDAAREGSAVTLRSPPSLRGHFDPMRLEQVVTNLLSNAIKYGRGKPIDLRVAEERGEAVLEVRDGGIGIAEADLERIFGRFERAVSARNYGGLGLGLFITREIAVAHGGQLEVASTPGEGSTFTMRFPLRRA